MNRRANQKVKKFYINSLENEPETISEKQLENLPQTLQNYLNKIGIVGKKEIKRVRLKQKGEFKLNPNSKWKKLTAEQYINTENEAFVWYAKISMIPLINFHVVDEFIQGNGALNAKLFNLITVVNEKGPKLDEGEFLRFLGEIPWYPSFFLNEDMECQKLDNNIVQVKLTHKNDIQISGNLIFDNNGLIKEFNTKRYYTDKDEISLEDWHGYWFDYEEIEGILVPTRFEVCWNLDNQEYYYIRANITNLEFNNPSIY